jgi:hypothetical protein
LDKLREGSGIQRMANLAHELQVIVQVMDGTQHRAQHFSTPIQVMKVSSAKPTAHSSIITAKTFAGIARAGLI